MQIEQTGDLVARDPPHSTLGADPPVAVAEQAVDQGDPGHAFADHARTWTVCGHRSRETRLDSHRPGDDWLRPANSFCGTRRAAAQRVPHTDTRHLMVGQSGRLIQPDRHQNRECAVLVGVADGQRCDRVVQTESELVTGRKRL